jgi:hypothetical protein
MGPVVGMIGAAQAQMALGYLTQQNPSPLGQLMSFDMQTFRTTGFRFDTAPDPTPDLTFMAATRITTSDFVVELRGRDEITTPVTATANWLSVAEFADQRPTPAMNQRAVFTCRSGLRAWQAATHLRSYWDGEISLIAMGDTPPNESIKT